MARTRFAARRLSLANLVLLFPLLVPQPSLTAQELVRAAKAGRLDRVQALLAAESGRIDTPDEAGYTALRWAGIRGHGEIARFLVGAGADPNSVGAEGGTPLHGAAHHDDATMMTALLAAGGKVQTQNQWGRTPLHVAARRGCLDVAEILLDAGANPDMITNEGWSTLAVAYRGGHSEMVNLLLAHGADPGLADQEGRRPGEVALKRPAVITLTRRQSDPYVGRYDLGGGFGFDVWRVGDRLRLMEFAPDDLIPVAPDTFFTAQEPWRVVFHRDESGAVRSMDVDFLRRSMTALRVVDPSAGYSYVGTSACAACHQAGPGGGPAGHWIASRHSRSFHTLSTDQAKLLAASREEYSDIEDPSREPRCLMCHLTAAQNPLAQWQSGSRPENEGVGCEACHGPGSAYMAPETMSDRSTFLANGGRIPDELTCRECHRDEAFNFLERLNRIRHVGNGGAER